jgi:GUN4-like/ARM-like repeat domain, GUN4-N terminal
MNTLNNQTTQFSDLTEKKQLQIIPELITKEEGIKELMAFLLEHKSEEPTLVIGEIYQKFYQLENGEVKEFLERNFPKGVVPLKSERNIDYLPIQQALVKQDFLEADLLTIQKLCELAGEGALKRKWLYFSEVDNFPDTDLHTIDQLWLMHSGGKFGYSIQRQMWLSVGCDFVKLWTKIGWKNATNWTRYPNEFIWDLTAPKGHLPTSNQLRGAKVITSLFKHPIWDNK